VVYPAFSLNCYGVIRGLGEMGVPVLALDENPNPQFHSRYCTGLRSPDPKEHPEAFATFLAELGARFKTKPVLYMMEDLYVWLAHRYRDRLEPYYRFSFVSEATLEHCLDKRLTFQVADRIGVPTPRTFYPKDVRELMELEGAVPLPAIVKPVVARFDFRSGEASKICTFPKVFGSKAVRADTFPELVRQFQRVAALGIEACVQEEIPGGQDLLYGSTLYANADSEALGIFVRTKLRQTPADFGTMTLGRAIASDEVRETSARMAKALGFRGICGMEYKYDPRDGQYKFLEINPRGELWMNLANHCGVNLPYLKYRDLTGNPVTAIQTNFSRKLVDLRDDFSLYFQRYRHDPRYGVSFADWFASLTSGEIEEVVFNWKDPVPGFLRYWEYAQRVFTKRTRGSQGSRTTLKEAP
jgi:predicted ATP-grasp superfamily ATP-dependent carboligase